MKPLEDPVSLANYILSKEKRIAHRALHCYLILALHHCRQFDDKLLFSSALETDKIGYLVEEVEIRSKELYNTPTIPVSDYSKSVLNMIMRCYRGIPLPRLVRFVTAITDPFQCL